MERRKKHECKFLKESIKAKTVSQNKQCITAPTITTLLRVVGRRRAGEDDDRRSKKKKKKTCFVSDALSHAAEDENQ